MRPLSFTLGMTIIQPKSGTLRTHSGKVEIEVTFPKKTMDKIFLSYLLSFNDDQEQTEDGSVNIPTVLEKYVFMNRKPSRVIFEIFLPVPGRYLFDIYGDIDDSSRKKNDRVLERLCQFRILSDRRFKSGELEPLPESPDIGWGPGPVCRHLGLVALSHFDSCLFMKPGEVRDIRFRMTRNLDVLAQLTHNYLPIHQLTEQVSKEILVHVQHYVLFTSKFKRTRRCKYQLELKVFLYLRKTGCKTIFQIVILFPVLYDKTFSNVTF